MTAPPGPARPQNSQSPHGPQTPYDPGNPHDPQIPLPAAPFVQRFSSTKRGARLARHLALHQLTRWGLPYGDDTAQAAALVVGELAANAVTHGCVPGRDFEVRMTLDRGTLRIEVSDTRTERRPPGPGAVKAAEPLAESGRGLLLVEALADRWAVLDRVPVGKTVRAELDLRKPAGPRP